MELSSLKGVLNCIKIKCKCLQFYKNLGKKPLEGISSINRTIPTDLCFLNSFINKHQGISKQKYWVFFLNSQVSHPQLNSVTESVSEISPDKHSYMYKRPMGHIINLC